MKLYRSVTIALLLVFAFSIADPNSGRIWADSPADDNSELGLNGAVYKFVFLSVLEGLYEDNVPNDVVDLIIPPLQDSPLPNLNEHFVYNCPLCMPAYYAFVTYRQRPPIPFRKSVEPLYNWGAPTLNDDLLTQLSNANHKTRMGALQELIESWILRKLDTTRMTESERTSLFEWIEKGRKRGMGELKRQAEGAAKKDACAICEGALGACKLSTNPNRTTN